MKIQYLWNENVRQYKLLLAKCFISLHNVHVSVEPETKCGQKFGVLIHLGLESI